ncbi:trehalose-phosphatase [Massilia sp. G4R7]|uniref:Trehalose 6-phosphate phosphatase n=1 Tax=Massilia phyllostachyos TaxID=2898585 RepID=A0ABS8Q5T7_9BURK|nr:trehalose-phosphatase [Massilia phyllostachyos]MCD2517105.1 trehalose-phosphatase [Massilia phyllostachyos]
MSALFSQEGRAALARLRGVPAIFGFDFDGTLAPIRPTPGEVAMEARTAGAFAALARRLPVAVVTGRGVADVRARLAGTPRWVIGNHGAEGMPGADPARQAEQAAICAGWLAQLAGTDALTGAGILLEDKRYTLSLHYRLAPEPESARARLLAASAALHPLPAIVPGKCVLNLLPAGSWDKFRALRELADGAPVFFAGDDENDEIVFRQAPPGWVTVKVGSEGPSAARFRLKSQEAMADCLELLLALCS